VRRGGQGHRQQRDMSAAPRSDRPVTGVQKDEVLVRACGLVLRARA
jgi:hypothetical protein